MMTTDQREEFHDSLSQREQDVLSLLAQNLSDREISARLFLSYTTVKWYNRQIFNKLGVDSRKKAVERAKLLGLLKTSPTSDSSKHNLPAQLTPFIGRMSELEHLSELIRQPSSRLITILAPGGMGKTRLALELAAEFTAEFADGVYFVSLAPLTLAEQMIPLIANDLGFPFGQDGRTPKQQLLDFLRHKHLLLLLDNFEHLLDGAPLVDEILQAAPHATILVTSRERLNLNGETVFTIEGLRYPDRADAEYSLDYPAIQLFLQSALRVYPQFVLQDQKSMLRICQLVQGMPLAIELAAAWVSTLSLTEIVTEITQSIDFLSTTMANVPPRLRSIRAVFDAAWSRLSADERQVFVRMSVFHGGCTREAARFVAGANAAILTGLVSKALVKFRMEVKRYDIHELVRQYAEEQLAIEGETDTTLARHLEYFGGYARQWSNALKSSTQLEALDKLDADYENIREAFERAIQIGQPSTIEQFSNLWYFFEIRSRYTEGMKLFEVAIEKLRNNQSIALAKLLAGYGLFLQRYYLSEKALPYAEESVAILRNLEAVTELPMPLMVLGDSQSQIYNSETAIHTYQEGMRIAQENNDEWAIACFLFLFGTVAVNKNQLDDGRKLLNQAHLVVKSMGNFWAMAFTLAWLGEVAFDFHDYEEAQSLFEETIICARKIHHSEMIRTGLAGLRDIAEVKGDYLLATHLTEDVLEMHRDAGNLAGIFDNMIDLARITLATGHIDKARHYVREALMMTENAEIKWILIFLTVAADLCQQCAMIELSIEILSFIAHHPKYTYLNEKTRKRSESLLRKGQSALPAHTYQASCERGKLTVLEDLTALLLLRI